MHSFIKIPLLLAFEVVVKFELVVQPRRGLNFGEIPIAQLIAHENQKFVVQTREHAGFVFVVNDIGESQVFEVGHTVAFVFKLRG